MYCCFIQLENVRFDLDMVCTVHMCNRRTKERTNVFIGIETIHSIANVFEASKEIESFMMVETQQIQFCSRLSLAYRFAPAREIYLVFIPYNHTSKSNWMLQMYLNFSPVLFSLASACSFTFHIIQFYYLFKLIDNRRGEFIEANSTPSSTVINISQPNSIWVCRIFWLSFSFSLALKVVWCVACRNGSDGNIYAHSLLGSVSVAATDFII